jgi:hypothetical protein
MMNVPLAREGDVDKLNQAITEGADPNYWDEFAGMVFLLPDLQQVI